MVELREAHVEELPLYCSMEKAADTTAYILPVSLAQHRREFARSDTVYLSIYDGRDLCGFLILVLDSDGISVEFRRIVVAGKGRGTGQQAIPAMEAYCRDRLGRKRVWLDVFDFNQRARHIYSKMGYKLYDEQDYQGKRLLLYRKQIA